MTASDSGFDPRGQLEAMVAKDPPPPVKSTFMDLLDQQLDGPRAHQTKCEQWLEEPWTRTGGRWVEVEG